MSELSPSPPAEQPRVITLFDLIFDLITVGFVCTGFYAGYSLGGFWTGLAGGVIGRGIFVAIIMTLRGVAERSAEKRQKQP